MKILIPVVSFHAAGGYRVLSELASAWTDAGHEVDFLVDERSPDPYFPTRARVLRFDRGGRVGSAPSTAGRFAESGNAPSIYLGMWRAIRRVGANYDLVLANHSLTAFPVALSRAGRAGRTRLFYYVQAYEPEYYALLRGRKARVLEHLSRLSYRLPLVQIANAPIYVGHEHIRAKSWVPPGLDATIFRPGERTLPRSPQQGWVIGTIGRREPAKGTIYALQGFERLAARHPGVRLRVAYGNLPDGWHHDRAEVVVPRNDRELADYYRSVDVLLAPGIVQLGACHYPVIEAMACGTPVVTTGYLPADPSNSWIVPIEDGEAIAKAVEAVMAMGPEAMRSRTDRALAATERFHWPNIAREMMALFESTGAASGPP
jgi:glycosyltransferase involved in cell wall biosynthesis